MESRSKVDHALNRTPPEPVQSLIVVTYYAQVMGRRLGEFEIDALLDWIRVLILIYQDVLDPRKLITAVANKEESTLVAL